MQRSPHVNGRTSGDFSDRQEDPRCEQRVRGVNRVPCAKRAAIAQRCTPSCGPGSCPAGPLLPTAPARSPKSASSAGIDPRVVRCANRIGSAARDAPDPIGSARRRTVGARGACIRGRRRRWSVGRGEQALVDGVRGLHGRGAGVRDAGVVDRVSRCGAVGSAAHGARSGQHGARNRNDRVGRAERAAGRLRAQVPAASGARGQGWAHGPEDIRIDGRQAQNSTRAARGKNRRIDGSRGRACGGRAAGRAHREAAGRTRTDGAARRSARPTQLGIELGAGVLAFALRTCCPGLR